MCPGAGTALFRFRYLHAFPKQPRRFRWRKVPARECLRRYRVSTTKVCDPSDLCRDANAHVYSRDHLGIASGANVLVLSAT